MRQAVLPVLLLLLCGIAAVLWSMGPTVNWPDRRPIGKLFIASHFHVSQTNPRGWFNDPALDIRGPEGALRFRKAALAYAERSIAILQRAGAQGVIVWNLEGEQFPHKTTYIGDPRMLSQLAPEADAVADDFFALFRNVGLRTGVTVRPQELTLDAAGNASQGQSWNYDKLLLQKIDYARRRWGATLFYIDSTAGPLWPAEAYRLSQIAAQRPDILLIPEHHDPRYYAFSAPYADMNKGDSSTSALIRHLYPNAFKVIALPDSNQEEKAVEAAYRNKDILLFPAWFDNPASRLVERLRAR